MEPKVLVLTGEGRDNQVPSGWSKYVESTPTGYRITGDRTAYRDLHLWVEPDRIVLSIDMGQLLDMLIAEGTVPPVSEFGLAAMLTGGLVPMRHTIFEGIAKLSMGDIATVERRNGAFELSWELAYPWLESLSRGDQVADEARVLEMLTESTVTQLAEYGDSGFLMLSAGKDSPAVALALANAGRTDIPCVTYRASPDNPEPPIAADICKRLGLSHRIVDIPQDGATIERILIDFFEGASTPGIDLSQIPYAVAAVLADQPTGAIFDGGGNDAYMGFPTSERSQLKQRFRIRGKTVRSAVRRVAPVDSKLNYAARSRAEVTLPGRLPRHHHVQRLRPSEVNMHEVWEAESDEMRDLGLFDVYDVFLRRHIHAGQVLLKQRLAADSRGLGTALPWCDDGIADYFFNLPSADRWNLETGVDKMLLRRTLLRYLDYDAAAVGKHYFLFDGGAFILRHMDFVRSEIDASPLWADDGLAMVHGWLSALERRPMLHHAILTVFMISGWSNHSAYARAAWSRQPS